MNILVIDLAAEHSGALNLLQCIHKEIVDYGKDNFFLMISVPQLDESSNLKIFRYPQVKKSWIKRLYYDSIGAWCLAKKYKADMILSLQNTLLCPTNCFKVLYMQQSLQYLDENNTMREDGFKLWFRKKIIGKIINLSSKYADVIFVQTQWIKERLMRDIDCSDEKITVIEPNTNIDRQKYRYRGGSRCNRFFYPAGAMPYKNHMVILRASKLLKEEGINDFTVTFTFEGNSEYIRQLKGYVNKYDLPVEFAGRLPHEEVLQRYTESVLIFTSEIETFGFPLREMSIVGGPIIATDRPYSNDVVGDYKNTVFVEHKNADALKEAMKMFVTGQYNYICEDYVCEPNNLVKEVINSYAK